MSKQKKNHPQHGNPSGHPKPPDQCKFFVPGVETLRIEPTAEDKKWQGEQKGYWSDQLKIAKWLNIITAGAAIVGLLVLGIYFLQWRSMQQSMKVDERAWITIIVPRIFHYNAPTISADIQLSDTGKTPATKVTGQFVATIMQKGEIPDFDNLSRNPHNNFYAGAIYPMQAPITLPITVSTYGPDTSQPIIRTPELERRINGGDSFIIDFGSVSYCDVFGVKHWTHFCNGSGAALTVRWIKECIAFNDVDTNSTPTNECKR